MRLALRLSTVTFLMVAVCAGPTRASDHRPLPFSATVKSLPGGVLLTGRHLNKLTIGRYWGFKVDVGKPRPTGKLTVSLLITNRVEFPNPPSPFPPIIRRRTVSFAHGARSPIVFSNLGPSVMFATQETLTVSITDPATRRSAKFAFPVIFYLR